MLGEKWEKYQFELKTSLAEVNLGALDEAILAIREIIRSNNTLWAIGNGGSAATASHFCVDMSKGCASRLGESVRSIPLMDLVPIQSAWSNDDSYDVALEKSLQNFARNGDLLFAISGSGNSTNVLNAIKVAKNSKMVTVGLTGFNGGLMSRVVDIEVNIPSTNMQIIEDAHHAICHFISLEV